MKNLILISLIALMTSCTYTINMVHSNGQASDVIDETATPTATTEISVPVSGI